ncbi:MAG: tRNA lysidine(34) synthetase TilS [Opitutales bacterium]|nr:tRNA lysidine(34) synthetase TilS [Opitutales bacterium]
MASETDPSFSFDPYDPAEKLLSIGIDRIEPETKGALMGAWQAGEEVGLACSGGLDSMFLLSLMAAWSRKNGGRVCVLHFNHRTRGDRSDGDEVLVSRAAGAFGLPFVSDHIRTDGADDPGQFSEDRLRRLRLEALHGMLKHRGIRLLLTAHHQDDRIESFLMRLSMGAPPESLSVPKPLHVMSNGIVHGRPLLLIRKNEINQWMTDVGIPWREDCSNASDAYFRNRIRNHLLPAWRDACPYELDSNLVRSLDEMDEDSRYMEQLADQLWNGLNAVDGSLDATALDGVARPVVRRIIARWLPELPHRRRTVLLDAIRDGKDLHMPLAAGRVLEFRKGLIVVRIASTSDSRPPYPNTGWGYSLLPDHGIICFPDGHCLVCGESEAREDALFRIRSGAYSCSDTVFLDKDALKSRGGLYVSSWKMGDGYHSLGAPGWKKLQDQFVNRKIPATARRVLPVVRIPFTDAIVWVPGLPPCEQGRVTESTKTLLRLTYT